MAQISEMTPIGTIFTGPFPRGFWSSRVCLILAKPRKTPSDTLTKHGARVPLPPILRFFPSNNAMRQRDCVLALFRFVWCPCECCGPWPAITPPWVGNTLRGEVGIAASLAAPPSSILTGLLNTGGGDLVKLMLTISVEDLVPN